MKNPFWTAISGSVVLGMFEKYEANPLKLIYITGSAVLLCNSLIPVHKDFDSSEKVFGSTPVKSYTNTSVYETYGLIWSSSCFCLMA